MLHDAATVEDWINCCIAEDYKLTKWEMDFVHSLKEQFETRGGISDRQEEILERIYAEKTS